MSISITWALEDETNVAGVEVWRADSKDGEYAIVGDLVELPTKELVDEDGDASKWYKLRVKMEDDSYGDFTLPRTLQKPAVCKVYGWVFDPTGRPIQDAQVWFSPASPPVFDSKTHTGSSATHGQLAKSVQVVTGADGYFEAELIRGLTLTVYIPDMALEREIVIPDEDSKSLKELYDEEQA